MSTAPRTTITHLYADDAGVSHFEDLEVGSALADFAPPAPPVFVSTPTPATRHLFLTLPGKWSGDLHPAPNRQIMTVLGGRLEVTTSDGVRRVFTAGDIALVEDTHGPGHATRNPGTDVVTLSVTQL